ncbi:hypothetical protein XENORESO_008466 [Xenotaenia resolanae]|uniref:Uncharacterized protein n=1 Tax=Xenotaenia resolanae TaxID=208358 RepID=A0ABV0W4J9_9TELE
MGHQGGSVLAGDDRGEVMSVCTGKISPSLLPSSCSNFTKQTLDFLNKFKENSFTQKDIDPRVQNRVEGCEAYCPEVWVLVQAQLHWRLIKLVQKHLSLERRNRSWQLH